MLTKRNCNLPLICLICGDAARGINFNVMSCMSCKTFFRRHGTQHKIYLICANKKNCEINRQTRSACSACRLKKCLTLGMNPKQIGNRRFKQENSKTIQNFHLPQPCSLNLLENDRSTLTRDEWNLLSNIIHAYDATQIIFHTKQHFETQSSLPPKIRWKLSTLFYLIKQLHSTFQLLIQHTPQYQYLPIKSCQTIIKRNSDIFTSINSMFILREINAIESSGFQETFALIYSQNEMRNLNKLLSQLNFNGTYIKIMLMIFAFSNTFSIIKYDSSIELINEINWIPIFNIQNMFLTMFWKYLLYQHGFNQAVRWFSEFVRYIVNLMRVTVHQRNRQHYQMINAAIEDTARSLTLNN